MGNTCLRPSPSSICVVPSAVVELISAALDLEKALIADGASPSCTCPAVIFYADVATGSPMRDDQAIEETRCQIAQAEKTRPFASAPLAQRRLA
jgi:hypothetical protein